MLPAETLLTELRAAPEKRGSGSRDEGRAGPLARRAEGSDSKTQTKHHQTAGRGESTGARREERAWSQGSAGPYLLRTPPLFTAGAGGDQVLPPNLPSLLRLAAQLPGVSSLSWADLAPSRVPEGGGRGALRGYEPSALPRGPDLAQKAPCRQPLLEWSCPNESQPHSLHRPRAHRQRGGRHGSGRRHPLQVQT